MSTKAWLDLPGATNDAWASRNMRMKMIDKIYRRMVSEYSMLMYPSIYPCGCVYMGTIAQRERERERERYP